MDKDLVSITIDEKYIKELENSDLISIFGKETLEEIQTAISDVTGLAFVTVDFRGNPLTKLTNFSDHCKMIRQNKMYDNICRLSDASGAIRSAVIKKTSIYYCPFRFLEMAIPVVINDTYFGGFIGGQVICNDAPNNIYKMSKQILPTDEFINFDDIGKNLERGKEYTYKEFLKITNLVELIISQMVKQNVISGFNQNKNLERISQLEYKLDSEKEKKIFYHNKFFLISNDINRIFLNDFLENMDYLYIINDLALLREYINAYRIFINCLLDSTNMNISNFLEIIKNFYYMVKVQYGDRFNYKVNEFNDKSTKLDYIVFPIVEFITLFGIKINEKYFCSINITKEDDYIILSITDKGMEITESILKEFAIERNLLNELEIMEEYIENIKSQYHHREKECFSIKNSYNDELGGNEFVIKIKSL